MSEILGQLAGAIHTDQGRRADFTVRELLSDFSSQLADQLPDQPETEATIRRVLGRSFWSNGDLVQASENLSRALELRIALLGENDPLTAQSRIDYALCLLWDSKVSQAEQQVGKALDVLGTDADNVDLVWAHRVLTGVYTEYGEYDRALFEAEMAWRKAETSMGAEHPLAALMHVYFAQATLGAGRLNAANRESQMALERMLEIRSETHVDVALAKRVRAMVLRYYGKLDEAISFAQQALEAHLELLGESDPVVQDYVALSQMHRQSRRWEEAETLARKAVDVAEKNSVQQQSQRILAYQNLAAVLAPKKPHDSLEMLDTAIAMKRDLVGNRPDLARLLVRQGRPKRSPAFARRCRSSNPRRSRICVAMPGRAPMRKPWRPSTLRSHRILSRH